MGNTILGALDKLEKAGERLRYALNNPKRGNCANCNVIRLVDDLYTVSELIPEKLCYGCLYCFKHGAPQYDNLP